MTVRDSIVAGAKKWLGVPYVWGGESEAEGGFDCSGLVIAVYKAAGVALTGRPRAVDFASMGAAVPLGQAQPGDLVYYDKPGSTDHVGIYIGGGKMINAPYSGASVRVDSVGSPTSVRRILGERDGLPLVKVEDRGPLFDANSAMEDAAGAVGNALSLPDWGGTALKLLATGVAGTLVIAGAMKAVTPAS